MATESITPPPDDAAPPEVPTGPDVPTPPDLPAPPEAPTPPDAPTPPADTVPPALELLVHGVGGATPQDMLHDPRTTRVTGDTTASVHRRTDDQADRPWDDAAPLREAYSWSGLTSGNAARALWLLLLPFMVANLAHWMRPAGHGRPRTRRAYETLVRLLALSLTVMLVAGACAVCLDLVAWQCAGSAACVDTASWLGPLAGPDGGWWSEPGRRLAVAALVPTAVVALLWWLSRRTWSAYESASPPPRPRGDHQREAALSLPGFWYGRGIVGRLRAAHTTVGLLTVCAALLAATGPHDRGPRGATALAVTGWLLTGLVVAGLAAVAVQQTRHGRTEEEIDEQSLPAAIRALSPAALALLALTLLHTAWSRPGWSTSGEHPGGGIFAALAVLQGLLVVGVALSARRLHRHAPRADRGALAGLGGAAVALLACTLGGVFTGGVAQRVADWLDPHAAPGDPDATIAGPPVLLSWQAAAVPAWLLVVLVLAVAALARLARRRRVLAPDVRVVYVGEPAEPLTERSGRIAGALARAELTDSAPVVVGWITGASLLLGLTAVTGSLTGESPAQAASDAPGPVAGLADFCQQFGSWLMGIGVLLLLAMGRRAYRDASARRTVGILWDVGTFWPRAAHPFAPPCYAERAVPDLSWRMGTWTEVTGGRLVISGHSQGSVLAAAAVWQLDTATRARIALLTHGSPLQRLYGRWFPAYFGATALRCLHRDLPHWRNLWRATDPIGGPVGVTGDDGTPVDRGPLTDPLHYGRSLLWPLPEPILGHTDYEADPAFAEERAALHRRLPGAPPGPRPTAPKAAAAHAATEPLVRDVPVAPQDTAGNAP
ncbi:hypothetical protein ACTWP5_12665 [Streptomyces sp. 4N509B]|uniref:hypothetical protein n=1 Tax=Streptomyces sp. 4N509B TaxID=3457413 RepID=UPI003FD3183B